MGGRCEEGREGGRDEMNGYVEGNGGEAAEGGRRCGMGKEGWTRTREGEVKR